jgi:hypothetical protein
MCRTAARSWPDQGGARNYLTGTFHSLGRDLTARPSDPRHPRRARPAPGGRVHVAGGPGRRGRRRAVTWAAVLGVLCILEAGFNGGSFVDRARGR